jgi:hypothetical protein
VPSAGQIDELTLLLLLAALAAVAAVVVRRRPWLGLVGYIAVLCFVPPWFGVSLGVHIGSTEAVGVVLLAALWLGSGVRLRYPDLVMAALLGLVVVCQVAGLVTLQATYAVLAGWGLPYLVARVVSRRVDMRWVYMTVAVAFAIVGLLALVEFATGTNLFVQLRSSSPLYANWAGIRVRGGLPRAEGAFGNSIAMGGALALAVPFVWVSCLRGWLKALCIALVVGGAFVTFSRIGMVSAVLALVLCVVFLRSRVSRAFTVTTVVMVLVGATLATPYVLQVFADAGDEAAGSAAYRGDLLSLLPSMSVLGQSAVAFANSAGTSGFGSFESIDSALLLTGLLYGLLPLAVLVGGAVVAAVALFRPDRAPAVVSVVSLLPALTSVAFITQFTVFFWFVVGLAASGARPQRADQASAPEVSVVRRSAEVFHPLRTAALVDSNG